MYYPSVSSRYTTASRPSTLGSIKRTTFSTTLELPSISKIIVCLQPSGVNCFRSSVNVVALMYSIDFEIFVSASMQECPAGFLFLCPGEDFQVTPTSFCWPDCPAYWSRDPSGVERLSADEATHLGFPSLQFNTRIQGLSWDASVYDGLRQWIEAKGCDPDTQDYARRFNSSLCQLSANRPKVPYAHGLSTSSDGVIFH